MSGPNHIPSLEMEIHSLRQKIKSSNYETMEECERLRAEIQKLYFQLARTTRPGRYAGKGKKTKHHKKEDKTITPEVIPPDLDPGDYFDGDKETAVTADSANSKNNNTATAPLFAKDNSERSTGESQLVNTLIPFENETKTNLTYQYNLKGLRVINKDLQDREKTIEERFSVVAERMQERRRLWQEGQAKKRPWWKIYGS